MSKASRYAYARMGKCEERLLARDNRDYRDKRDRDGREKSDKRDGMGNCAVVPVRTRASETLAHGGGGGALLVRMGKREGRLLARDNRDFRDKRDRDGKEKSDKRDGMGNCAVVPVRKRAS